jgi:SulP family sulfate permease
VKLPDWATGREFARFHPRLLDHLKGYDRARFMTDAGAGLTVGVIALPLAMAFAIASGVKPEQGLFTAIIAGFLISALGGSSVQIGGPAGAFIVIVYGIVERYGFANLLIATVLAGLLMFTMGLLKLGALVRHIPVTIVIGFTNGIAVLVAVSQFKDLFGLSTPPMPADFFTQIGMLVQYAGTVNWVALAVGVASLALLFAWPHVQRHHVLVEHRTLRTAARMPAPMAVLVLATVATALLNLHVETIGSRFGGIPQALPAFAWPDVSWRSAKELFIPTITIAMLGAIESLLCARVADNLVANPAQTPRHDPNQELMAQGIANVVTPFFGGIPATGTIARTVTNVRAGATSPVAGIVHAVTLLLVVLIAAPLAEHVPLAALAGILLFVAWNMGEWHEFARLRQFSVQYRVILVGTFLLTVVFDLTVAVQVGLVLACAFFIYRMGTLFRVEAAPDLTSAPAGVVVRRLYGALFFGAVDKLESVATALPPGTRALVLEMHRLISLDATGVDALMQLRRTLDRAGIALWLCDLNEQPLSLLRRSGFLAMLGEDRVTPTLSEALTAASAPGADSLAPSGRGLG